VDNQEQEFKVFIRSYQQLSAVISSYLWQKCVAVLPGSNG
jgi:hypothetical protein